MKSQIIALPTKCRPLLTPSIRHPNQTSFLQLPYEYELKDIKLLQSYLCPCMKVIGVDFEEKPQVMPKLKYKTVAIRGAHVDGGDKVLFRGTQGYLGLDWVVDVVMEIPMNSQEFKMLILKNLAMFSVENSKEVPINTPDITQEQLRNSRIYCLASFPKKYMNSRQKRRAFISKIPIGILVPKIDSYDKQAILEIIADDLTKSINIMTQNELGYRSIGRHQSIIPLQNYSKNISDKDQQFLKLTSKTPQKTQTIPANQLKITSEPLSPTVQPKNSKVRQKQNKNFMQLLLLVGVLILVVGGYVLVKFM